MASKEPLRSQESRANSFAVLESEGGSAAAVPEKELSAAPPQESAAEPVVKSEAEITRSIDNGVKECMS